MSYLGEDPLDTFVDKMKTPILLCACFISLVVSSPVPTYEYPTNNQTYILTEPSPGIYVKEDLTVVCDYYAAVSDVKIFFRSRTTGDDAIEVDFTDPSTLDKTDFSNAKESIFIVHGWHNDKDSPLNTHVAEAYLKIKDVNIFVVDWGKIASELYAVAQFNVQGVGEILGGLINNLVKSAVLDSGKIILVGHSLGAHVAGVAGTALEGVAKYVVGLDPAGPLFLINNRHNRITTDSGKFVHIIHSNANLLGWNHELGHADYWPNGGHTQPGCGVDITGSCAHGRSYLYFSESLVSGSFIARVCQDWDTYESGACANNYQSYLGQDPVDKSAAGNYYLETNEDSPYAKGDIQFI